MLTKKLSVLALLFTLIGFNAISQNQKAVLFTINNEPVTVEEFDAVFKKNNNKSAKPTEKEVLEYLDLYKKFKMKVKEAYSLGLDTNQTFINEFGMYRRQLAQPYLTDKESSGKLVQEAYDRLKFEVKASHILIRVDENASPKDTAKAFAKILEIKARLNKGEDFAKLAKDLSEDPSAKDNSGNLGYFTALRMIYPFENVAYNLPVGKISEPFRTQFGYHVVRIEDKRPTRGELRVAHIMTMVKPSDTDSMKAISKRKIFEIYELVQKGGGFEELSKQFSEDNSTSRNGGQLPWFGSGRMVPEFEDAAFNLKKDGDVSEPVLTMYGWHIIKRLESKTIQSFDQMKTELEQKVSRDGRTFLNKKSFVVRLKKEYKYKEFTKAKEDFFKALDTSFMSGNFIASSTSKLTMPIFVLDSINYSQTKFAAWLEDNQSGPITGDRNVILNKMFDQYVETTVLDYEDSKLESKYADFRNLVREYREGILLFDLTDKQVWSRAVTDTAGLQEYYEKNKFNYLWNERADAVIYTCLNEKVAKSVRKLAKDSKMNNEAVLTSINKKNSLNLRIADGKFEKPMNDVFSKIEWKEGLSDNVVIDKNVVFVKVNKILKPEPKLLNEIRGIMTSDYQNYLEKEWIKNLEKKYKINVNQDVLKTLW